MTFEEYESAVVALVAERLKNEEWYSGVVCDTIESSFWNESSIEDAALIAEMETHFQDGPKSEDGW